MKLTNESDYSGRRFIFDDDNKQVVVKNSQNQPTGQYFYDGSGKWVKKVTNLETTIFVYDGTNKLVAEYLTANPPQNPTTNYTATDPLGSPRVVTNSRKEIVSRRDFLPFGEELAPDSTYRTANLKYGSGDTIRQKFTGYQRDEETQLDFAEARYYNNSHGRFTAVDPLLASGKSANPQTFNRYVYTMNRPLILTDSTGLQAGKYMDEIREVIRQEVSGYWNKDGQKYKLDAESVEKIVEVSLPAAVEQFNLSWNAQNALNAQANSNSNESTSSSTTTTAPPITITLNGGGTSGVTGGTSGVSGTTTGTGSGSVVLPLKDGKATTVTVSRAPSTPQEKDQAAAEHTGTGGLEIATAMEAIPMVTGTKIINVTTEVGNISFKQTENARLANTEDTASRIINNVDVLARKKADQINPVKPKGNPTP